MLQEGTTMSDFVKGQIWECQFDECLVTAKVEAVRSYGKSACMVRLDDERNAFELYRGYLGKWRLLQCEGTQAS
jgi:hypothetical protein